jgi:SAM-dependent methyltransferase
MELEEAAVRELLPDVRGLMTLDVGCGTGRYLRELDARGALAFGMDLSAPMLDRARLNSAKVVRADLRALPFASMTIDLAICGLALGDIAELERALGKSPACCVPAAARSTRWFIPRASRPGGREPSTARASNGQSRATGIRLRAIATPARRRGYRSMNGVSQHWRSGRINLSRSSCARHDRKKQCSGPRP